MNHSVNAYQNILELIGDTPLIKLNRTVKDFPGQYFAKFEAFNPKSVTKIETITAKIKDCAMYKEATLSFFSPIELPIIAFVAAPIPTPTAMIVK